MHASALPATSTTGTVVPASTDGEIRWGSYISKLPTLEAAIEEAVLNIQASIGEDAQPQLAMVFVTSRHEEEYSSILSMLRARLPSLKYLFGCSVSVWGVSACARGSSRQLYIRIHLLLMLGLICFTIYLSSSKQVITRKKSTGNTVMLLIS